MEARQAISHVILTRNRVRAVAEDLELHASPTSCANRMMGILFAVLAATRTGILLSAPTSALV